MSRIAATLAVALLCAAPPALGQNLTGEVTALCRAGEGCACYDGAAPQDILWVMGLPTGLPDGWAGDVRSQTVVIEPQTGRVYRSSAPRDRINATYGGSGRCEPDPRPEEPVPLDGTWQWHSLGQSVAGCPAMMAAALAAGTETGPAARVTWDGVFDPARLADSLPQPEAAQMQPYQWRKLGPARWVSDNLRERSCQDGVCVDLALSLSMALASPGRITGLLNLRSRIDNPDTGASAVLAGLGVADCRVRIRYEIRHTGP